MEHLIKYSEFILESNTDLNDIVEYLKHDLDDDGFYIRKSDELEFIKHKWKNISWTYKNKQLRDAENEFYKGKELFIIDVISRDLQRKGLSYHMGFNLYDVAPSIRRLLDSARDLGYDHFEVRKVTNMSRRSIDVTSQFLGTSRLPESANRDIIILQILITKS